jgi:predicted SAM-dependent methyltransferase
MRGVLHHLSREQRIGIISEAYRVLHDGGYLFVYEPDSSSKYRRLTWFLADVIGFENESSPYVEEIGYPTEADISEWCQDAGFELREVDESGSLLAPIAFLYSYEWGVDFLDRLRPLLPVSWWNFIVAQRPT